MEKKGGINLWINTLLSKRILAKSWQLFDIQDVRFVDYDSQVFIQRKTDKLMMTMLDWNRLWIKSFAYYNNVLFFWSFLDNTVKW